MPAMRPIFTNGCTGWSLSDGPSLMHHFAQPARRFEGLCAVEPCIQAVAAATTLCDVEETAHDRQILQNMNDLKDGCGTHTGSLVFNSVLLFLLQHSRHVLG